MPWLLSAAALAGVAASMLVLGVARDSSSWSGIGVVLVVLATVCSAVAEYRPDDATARSGRAARRHLAVGCIFLSIIGTVSAIGYLVIWLVARHEERLSAAWILYLLAFSTCWFILSRSAERLAQHVVRWKMRGANEEQDT